jgi:hypothetical protein
MELATAYVFRTKKQDPGVNIASYVKLQMTVIP